LLDTFPPTLPDGWKISKSGLVHKQNCFHIHKHPLLHRSIVQKPFQGRLPVCDPTSAPDYASGFVSCSPALMGFLVSRLVPEAYLRAKLAKDSTTGSTLELLTDIIQSEQPITTAPSGSGPSDTKPSGATTSEKPAQTVAEQQKAEALPSGEPPSFDRLRRRIGPNILLFMSNRTRCILFISVKNRISVINRIPTAGPAVPLPMNSGPAVAGDELQAVLQDAEKHNAGTALSIHVDVPLHKPPPEETDELVTKPAGGVLPVGWTGNAADYQLTKWVFQLTKWG
jgi:hypothetical protein